MGLLSDSAKVSDENQILINSSKGKKEMMKIYKEEHRKYRDNEIGMIFQEPMTSLNPSLRCGEQVEESIRLHLKLNTTEAKKRVIELFNKVLLPDPERIYRSYPHQLSGGQRQRVMIALSISCEKKVLIADDTTNVLY